MATENPENVLDILRKGEITSESLIPIGSNYTFLVDLKIDTGSELMAIYKPRIGEAPLRDFPRGTLCFREYATFVIANGLGWNFVPATVIREGPYGIGSMQLFKEHIRGQHYFTLLEQYDDDLKRICLFDLLINNAGIAKDNLTIRMNKDEWDKVMLVNVRGTFQATKAVVPSMRRCGRGKIINISSGIYHLSNCLPKKRIFPFFIDFN